MLGTVVFFALIFIIGATRDGYSLLTDEISQLSASGVPGAWAQTTNFIVFGLIVIGLAVGLHRGITDGHGSIIGPVLIGAFGLLAAFAMGCFPQTNTAPQKRRSELSTRFLLASGSLRS